MTIQMTELRFQRFAEGLRVVICGSDGFNTASVDIRTHQISTLTWVLGSYLDHGDRVLLAMEGSNELTLLFVATGNKSRIAIVSDPDDTDGAYMRLDDDQLRKLYAELVSTMTAEAMRAPDAN